jgi:protein phosphatase
MIPVERAHLNVAAISHPGMSGKNNEDRYGVSAFRINSDDSPASVLAVVADGIGGHRAGEVAAELAVEAISQVVAGAGAGHPVQTLQNAIVYASQVINQRAETDPTMKGMGTTCACVLVIGDRLYTASVGDSRVYLIDNRAIHQVTTDHTWVQEAIEHGALTEEEARSHPNAHVIRRYLGSKNDVVPDTRLRLSQGEEDRKAEANQGAQLQPGDCILLCSDGLTDLVDDSEIYTALKTGNLDQSLEKLVKLANQRGGHDNITAVALQVPLPELEKTAQIPVAATGRRTRLGATCLTAGLVLAAAILAFGGLFWYFNRSGSLLTPTSTANPSLESTLFPQLTSSGPGTPLPGTIPTGTASTASARTPTAAVLRTQGSANITLSPATLTPWPTNTPGP